MPSSADFHELAEPPHHEASDVLVKRLFSRISEVSTIPSVALRIVEVAGDVDTDTEQLHEVVQYDSALVARIMRTVNSSYYSPQNKVADLKLAITLLGFKEIRNLAMTAYIAQLFKNDVGHGPYSREGLWNHLIAVAVVSRRVAKISGKVPPREAYLAGLLHDMGLIFLDQYLHGPFCQVVDAAEEEISLEITEREILGFTHGELGEYVAREWNLPDHLVAAIGHHHRPLTYRGGYRDMVCTVALADFFCGLKGVSGVGISSKVMPPRGLFSQLGLCKAQVAQVWENLAADIESADVMALLHKSA